MKIEELSSELTATLTARIGSDMLQFDTLLRESVPKKHSVLADPIYQDGKIVSFRGKGLIIDMTVQPPGMAPYIFKNVTLLLMKRPDGTLCYAISSLAEGKLLNRRESFRCFVGLSSSVQAGGNSAARDAIIRDISAIGFSVVCDADIEFHENQVLHVLLNDFLEELAENYNFHLYGIIVRIEELENGKLLYGCRLNNRVPGIDSYIMKKERLRMKKQKGT